MNSDGGAREPAWTMVTVHWIRGVECRGVRVGGARALSHFGTPAARLSEKKPDVPEEKQTVSCVTPPFSKKESHQEREVPTSSNLFSYDAFSFFDCCEYLPMSISACSLRQERRFPRFGARLYAMVSLRISIGCPSLFRNWCSGVSPCGVETTRRHKRCITGAGGFAG